jgi:Trk K+ transport system NAD-binding subunit
MRIPVVAVERDPDAPGIALARQRNVPVVVGDISQPDVYKRARISRSQTLMALTSNDSVNLEAVLYAREQRPDLRVVLRLFDDAFASTVYRALRASYPTARIRSRSVSYLAAPAFAAAMMGPQVLAAIPVERQMLLIATVGVRGRLALVGQSVGEAFRPGGWRVVGLQSDQGHVAWNPDQGRVLTAEDRVVVVATREGLGLLLQRRRGASVIEAPSPVEEPPAPTGPREAPGAVPPAGVPAQGHSAVPRFRRRPDESATSPLPHLPRAQPSPPYPPAPEPEGHAGQAGHASQAEGPSR